MLWCNSEFLAFLRWLLVLFSFLRSAQLEITEVAVGALRHNEFSHSRLIVLIFCAERETDIQSEGAFLKPHRIWCNHLLCKFRVSGLCRSLCWMLKWPPPLPQKKYKFPVLQLDKLQILRQQKQKLHKSLRLQHDLLSCFLFICSLCSKQSLPQNKNTEAAQ